MRIVLKKPPRTSSDLCRGLLGWLTLFQYRCIALLWQVHRCFLHIAPAYLSSIFILTHEVKTIFIYAALKQTLVEIH